MTPTEHADCSKGEYQRKDQNGKDNNIYENIAIGMKKYELST